MKTNIFNPNEFILAKNTIIAVCSNDHRPMSGATPRRHQNWEEPPTPSSLRSSVASGSWGHVMLAAYPLAWDLLWAWQGRGQGGPGGGHRALTSSKALKLNGRQIN